MAVTCYARNTRENGDIGWHNMCFVHSTVIYAPTSVSSLPEIENPTETALCFSAKYLVNMALSTRYQPTILNSYHAKKQHKQLQFTLKKYTNSFSVALVSWIWKYLPDLFSSLSVPASRLSALSTFYICLRWCLLGFLGGIGDSKSCQKCAKTMRPPRGRFTCLDLYDILQLKHARLLTCHICMTLVRNLSLHVESHCRLTHLMLKWNELFGGVFKPKVDYEDYEELLAYHALGILCLSCTTCIGNLTYYG
jgi:hypothetical protein